MSEEKPKKKAKKTAEADGANEHKKNWREVYATVEDIQQFLSNHVYLRHNVITKRVEYRQPEMDYFNGGPGSTPESLIWQPISDWVVNSLWKRLSMTKPARAQDIYRVIESDFVPEYHPFLYYLDHLPPWDGMSDYILEMSLSVSVKGGVE